MNGDWWQSPSHLVCFISRAITRRLGIASLRAYDFGDSDPEVMHFLSLWCQSPSVRDIFPFWRYFVISVMLRWGRMSLEFRPWGHAGAELLMLISKYFGSSSAEWSLLWKCWVSFGVRDVLAKDILWLLGISTCRFATVSPAYADTVHLTIWPSTSFPIGTLFVVPWFFWMDDLSRGCPPMFRVDCKRRLVRLLDPP